MDYITFLDAVFGKVPAGESICIARLKSNNKWDQYGWAGAIKEEGANYYCVSTIDAQPGYARRAKGNCRALYAIVLDDIGGKYPEPPVPPSYVLESSEGNFQWGYFLEEPAEGDALDVALNVWRGFGDAGYSDDVATPTRVVRLPGSINVKEGCDDFVSRITVWEPGRLFDPLQLAADSHVAPRAARAERVQSASGDPLVEWATGRLEGFMRDGLLDIRCPWGDEHTDDDRGAALFPMGYEGRDTRGFKCLHTHCADRTIHEFTQWVAQQGGGIYTSGAAAPVTSKFAGLMAITPKLDATQLPNLKLTGEGMVKVVQLCSIANIEWALGSLGIKARIDMEKKEHVLEAPWANSHSDCFEVLNNKLQEVGIDARQTVAKLTVAMGEGYHPIAEAIPVWDGVSRFDDLAASVNVAPESAELWPIALRRWILQAVAAWTRWEHPVQCGAVLVLIGGQGKFKTQWFESLHPRVLTGRHLKVEAKDSIMEALSAPIVEMGELDATFRKSDVSALKAFLTNKQDKWRAPYAERAQEWPRTTVWGASVNDSAFLQDSQNRRFWPIKIDSCNPRHTVDMMQLFAEAKSCLDAGEVWWLNESEMVLQECAAETHRAGSETEDQFDKYFNEARMETPREDWTHANAGEIQQCMGVGVTGTRGRSELVELLCRVFNSKVKRAGLRGWWVPITKSERNASGVPVRGLSGPPLELVQKPQKDSLSD